MDPPETHLHGLPPTPDGGIVSDTGTAPAGEDGIEHLAAVLESTASPRRKADALRQAQLVSATSLYLGPQETPIDGLTDEHVAVLADTLHGSPLLQDVQIYETPVSDVGMQALVRLFAGTPALRVVSLGDCHLSTVGVLVLAAWLRTNPPLQTLCITGKNRFGNEALTALADSVRRLAALTKLCLYGCPMGSIGAEAWAAVLRSGTALRRVGFGGETMQDNEVAVLADAALAQRPLIKLVLAAPNMTDQGMTAIANMIQRNPSLQVLSLGLTPRVSTTGQAALAAAIRRNDNLALRKLFSSAELGKFDDSVPHDIANTYSYGQTLALTHYRVQARVRRRMAVVAVLRRAWQQRSGVRPPAAAPALDAERRGKRRAVSSTAATPGTGRAAALAHMLTLRRLCRLRDRCEVVEPFSRAVVLYL